MGHGGGGAMSAELVEHLFLPAFGPPPTPGIGDSAVLEVGGARLAFSTDSFVVRPLFFPGGSHRRPGRQRHGQRPGDGGRAAAGPVDRVHPRGGHRRSTRSRRVAQRRRARRRWRPGVKLVTGDTKVVDSGHGDGVYVNTAGIGLVDERVDIRPQRADRGRRGASSAATSACTASR